MELQKQIEVKRKIKQLFNDGINQKAVFNLIDELLTPKTIIFKKEYKHTENAFESDLMLFKRAGNNNYIFDTFLKEVK